MIGGPVLWFEAIRAARRPWLYVGRGLAGLGLLAMMALHAATWARGDRSWLDPLPDNVSTRVAQEYAQSLVALVIGGQVVGVLVMAPGLAAGSISDEARRKTLHYLMASRLSAAEIVLGKLAARAAVPVTFLALGLPVVSLATLLGGVDPRFVGWAYAGMFATAISLTALAVLASTVSRTTRDASGLAYSLTALWTFGPPLFEATTAWRAVPAGGVLSAVVDAIASTSPWIFVTAGFAEFTGTGSSFISPSDLIARMIVGQLVVAVAATLIACWRLRPSFRAAEARTGRLGALARLAGRARRRPPIGDDPIFWREAYVVGRKAGLGARVAQTIVGTLLIGVLAAGLVWTGTSVARALIAGTSLLASRSEFSAFARGWAGCVSFFAMIALAGRVAGSMAAEREADSWTSLLATPLTARDHVRGQLLGAIVSFRWTWAAIAMPWLIGVAAWAVHPFGLAAALLALAVNVGLAAAIGLACSLWGRTAWKAQSWAQGIVLGLQCCCFLGIPTPALTIGVAALSPDDLWRAFDRGSGNNLIDFSTWAIAMVVYAAGAAGLIRLVLTRFDDAVGRPRRPGLVDESATVKSRQPPAGSPTADGPKPAAATSDELA